MLERRVERYREGDIVYPLQNHIVIIGFDNMVPTLIQQICDDTHYGNCHILIQSTQPAQEIRSKIHTELDAKNEKRIVVRVPGATLSRSWKNSILPKRAKYSLSERGTNMTMTH